MSGNVGSRGEGAGSVNSEVKRFAVGGAEPYREQTSNPGEHFHFESSLSGRGVTVGWGGGCQRVSAALFINQFLKKKTREWLKTKNNLANSRTAAVKGRKQGRN